jgi:hypothetical protein
LTDTPVSFRTPYAPSPGSSTPSPHVSPAEGRAELRAFVYLSLVSTFVIVVVGLGIWWMVH